MGLRLCGHRGTTPRQIVRWVLPAEQHRGGRGGASNRTAGGDCRFRCPPTATATEDFCRDGGVLFVSLHQFPFYPGSGAATSIGEGNGRGCIVNIPLPKRSAGPEYKLAFKRVVLPVLRRLLPT